MLLNQNLFGIKTKNIVGKVGNHTLEFVEGVAHDVAVEFAKVVAFKQG